MTSPKMIAAMLMLVSAAATAHAAPSSCPGVFEATSNVRQSLTSATEGATSGRIKRSYDSAYAAGRREAIAAWSAKVRGQCGRAFSRWSKAQDKTVEACDQAMGGRFAVCAKAIPAR